MKAAAIFLLLCLNTKAAEQVFFVTDDRTKQQLHALVGQGWRVKHVAGGDRYGIHWCFVLEMEDAKAKELEVVPNQIKAALREAAQKARHGAPVEKP